MAFVSGEVEADQMVANSSVAPCWCFWLLVDASFETPLFWEAIEWDLCADGTENRSWSSLAAAVPRENAAWVPCVGCLWLITVLPWQALFLFFNGLFSLCSSVSRDDAEGLLLMEEEGHSDLISFQPTDSDIPSFLEDCNRVSLPLLLWGYSGWKPEQLKCLPVTNPMAFVSKIAEF